jgi:hypothetical protein
VATLRVVCPHGRRALRARLRAIVHVQNLLEVPRVHRVEDPLPKIDFGARGLVGGRDTAGVEEEVCHACVVALGLLKGAGEVVPALEI